MHRILHVYSGNLYGGIETMLHTLATTAPSDLTHDFALCFPGRLADELRAVGKEPHMLGPVRMRAPWTVWQARRRLRRLAADFDLVLLHAPWITGLLGPALPQPRRIFWAHDVWYGTHPVEWLARWSRPSRVIANSQFTQSTLAGSFPIEKIEVIYCPVAPRETWGTREADRRSQNIHPDEVVVVTASRLEEWKGHRLLLDAFALVEDDRLHLWIIGGPHRPPEERYLQELKTYAKDLGIANRVNFLGQRDDVPRWLQAADIHCQPNTQPEPFGVVFLEAMYAGLPVITTRMGAPVEYIDRTCGTLVPPGSADALARALDSFAADKEARSKIRKTAPVRARDLCAPELAHQALQRLCVP